MLQFYRDKIARACLTFGIKHSPDYFNACVNERASIISRNVLMKEMDQQRLLHCSLCNIRSPLRNVDGSYLCENHYQFYMKNTQEAIHG